MGIVTKLTASGAPYRAQRPTQAPRRKSASDGGARETGRSTRPPSSSTSELARSAHVNGVGDGQKVGTG